MRGAVKRQVRTEINVLNAESALVMVVDDEVLIRLVAAENLRDAGFRVDEASDADEAITLLATDVPYHVIFSDVNMPGSIDGIGLVAYVKRHYPYVSMVLTSGGIATCELLKAGADAVIPKPYTDAILVATIARMLAAPIE